MSEQIALPVIAPSLPKGGGAIQSIGKGRGAAVLVLFRDGADIENAVSSLYALSVLLVF